MKIGEIKELKRAIVDLHKFCNGGAIRERKGDIDKYGTGFNVDGRRKMSGSHTIYYDTHYGYYGNSSSYSQIELPSSTHEIFWKCFDEYLNEHQDEILNAVCKKMQLRLSKETDTIKEEIDHLTTLMNELDDIKAE
ncbi:MAG: hypothetical protein K5920_09465 [Bacteroidales bacterium]|nr:hypothetical protein [Bacteroidales bacterium]